MTQQLQNILDAAWEDRANISVKSASKEVSEAVEHVISQLNSGKLRVATRDGVGQWTTHQWIKKAVLLSFRLKDNEIVKAGDLGFYDKVPTKFGGMSEAELKATGVRVVPPAVARRGLRCKLKRSSASFGSARRAMPYSEVGPGNSSVSPRSSIHGRRGVSRPERMSIATSGSVYGPDVS